MKFRALVVIAPDDLETQAIESAQSAGAAGITILNGRGIGGEARKSFMGLRFEGSQSILLMIVAQHMALPLLKTMRELLDDNGDSRGLAFTVPIEHLAGIEMSQVMKFEENLKSSDEI